MNQDYLWDRTGEPDAQVERLERVLGTLRYKPLHFEIPPDLQIEKTRNILPLLAIAAMILMTLFAGGMWISLNRPLNGEIGQVPLPLEALPTLHQRATATRVQPVRLGKGERVRASGVAVRAERAKEREEAEAAKQQLMLALRLASSKLSLAQKKAKGAPNIISNQHKVG